MELDDNQLVKNYLEGNSKAFEELVKKYLKPIYNFLYRMAGDRQTAEDLAQDTFFKAWKNLRRFDQDRNPARYRTEGSGSGFKTWLFTVAKNTAFDFFRKKKEIPFSAFTDEEGNSKLEEIEENEILPDEILAREDITKELEEKLKEIPEYYRIILLLRYKEDFSLREITEILGEPYNTVKSRHQRALARLKKAILSDYCV